MKRVLIAVLAWFLLCTSAYAEADIYIWNPLPEERLHLRVSPSRDAESLGKYYNGAPVTRTGYFNHNGWVQVAVGYGNAVLTGYMDDRYLSYAPSDNAMPQYLCIQSTQAYQQPSSHSRPVKVLGGSLLSLMGFSDDWWHLVVHTGTSEGDYSCFMPAGAAELVSLSDGRPVNAYISNPDTADRLHLRTSPSADGKSLGKYYNGCVAVLKGFTLDAKWIEVELFGRTGYMMREFVYLEGQGSNPTYYGIPTSTAARNTILYLDPELTISAQMVAANQSIEILGLVNDEVLHVRLNDTYGFMRWIDTCYTDPK